jgi:hypothetical protein
MTATNRSRSGILLAATLVTTLLCEPGSAAPLSYSLGNALPTIWDAREGFKPEDVSAPWTPVDSADPEEPVLNNELLELATSGDGENMAYVQDDLGLPAAFRAEFALQVRSGTGSASNRAPAAFIVTVAPGVGTALFLGVDEIFLTSEGDVRGSSANVDTDGLIHEYVLTISPEGAVAVSQDGVPRLSDTVFTSIDAHGSLERVAWGELSRLAHGAQAWQYVRHNGLIAGATTTTTSTTSTTTTTLPPPCPVAALSGCVEASAAKLKVDERKAGKEKMNLEWSKFPDATVQSDFGDPVEGDSTVAACVYNDAGNLVLEQFIDRAGDTCGKKPCWKRKGFKGYLYKDKTGEFAGVFKTLLLGGKGGKGKAALDAKNNASKGIDALPLGVAAALSGSVAPTLQLSISDGLCLSASLVEIKKDEPGRFDGSLK